VTDLVGIIGAGRIGQAMARTALRAGRRVVIANSRGPESLASVVSELGDGVSAGTVEQASAAGIVVIAVPWDRVPAAVQGIDWDGQAVVDATNDWAANDLNGRTSSELVADLVAGARVVKAANTLGAEVLGSDPQEAGGRRVIFVSGFLQLRPPTGSPCASSSTRTPTAPTAATPKGKKRSSPMTPASPSTWTAKAASRPTSSKDEKR